MWRIHLNHRNQDFLDASQVQAWCVNSQDWGLPMGRWIWMWMIRLEQDHSTCNIQQHRSGTRPVCGRRVRPGGTEGDGGSASAVRLESPRTYERWASNLKASCSARSDSAWFRSSIRPAIYSSLQSEPKSLRGPRARDRNSPGGNALSSVIPLRVFMNSSSSLR